jgi:hypothetical protein
MSAEVSRPLQVFNPHSIAADLVVAQRLLHARDRPTAQRPRSAHDRWLRFSCRAIFSEIATRRGTKDLRMLDQALLSGGGKGFHFSDWAAIDR